MLPVVWFGTVTFPYVPGSYRIRKLSNGGNFIALNIVVAAAGRKLGKTLFCTELVRTLHDSGSSVAFYKLKKQDEEGVELLPGPGRKGCDTWRAHSAGADEVALLKYQSEGDLREFIVGSSRNFDVVVWETNSAVTLIEDPLIVYIDGEVADPKNPELTACASVLLDGPLDVIASATIGLTLSVGGLPGFNPVLPGWKLWLETGGSPVFGKGVASLLESIRDSGSILAAAKSTGIQYRRVWTLVSRTEDNLGVKLIRRNRGGAGGGGSSLTPVATMLLKRYHFLEDAMATAAKKLEEDR